MNRHTNMGGLPVPPGAARVVIVAAAACALVAMIVYALTAHRTVTWWENGIYALSATTLSIPGPPGSLLLGLLGWVITRLSPGINHAFALNLFTGFLAACTVGVICLVAGRLRCELSPPDSSLLTGRHQTAVVIGTILGGLTVAFSKTLWLYAIKFTPYILTALFTALIIRALVSWWGKAEQRNAIGQLLLIALLFGLDFSVHRTNAVLLPGALLWILIRRPRVFLSIKAWLAGVVGLVFGLAFHLLLIPIAKTKPPVMIGDAGTLSGFWDYVSLKQYGGGFLMSLFSRKAPFWSVQVTDFLNALKENLMPIDGGLGFMGALPALLGLIGLFWLWRRNARLGLAWTAVFLATSFVTILYFNIPDNFFRSLHRHYLPVMVICWVWVVCGAAALVAAVWQLARPYRFVSAGLVVLLVLAAGVHQLIRNYSQVDFSDAHFCHDTAMNLFNALPENAIVLTGGDNDSYTPWYLHYTEGVRPDVDILNINLLNTAYYVRHWMERDASFPLQSLRDDLADWRLRLWSDTTISVPVTTEASSLGVDDSVLVPDSLFFQIAPNLGDKYLMTQDWVMLQLILENAWRRPICITSSVSQQTLVWLRQFLRLEGPHWRLVPVESPPLDKTILQANLLVRATYRGYNDPGVPLEAVTRQTALNLYWSFLHLADAEVQEGDTAACHRVVDRVFELLPPDRLQPPGRMVLAFRQMCGED